MKIFVRDSGDRSVGISPWNMTIEIEGCKTKDFLRDFDSPKEERLRIRHEAIKFFCSILEDNCGNVRAMFDDEQDY